LPEMRHQSTTGEGLAAGKRLPSGAEGC
jgi:hypothetical protein